MKEAKIEDGIGAPSTVSACSVGCGHRAESVFGVPWSRSNAALPQHTILYLRFFNGDVR